MNRKMVYLLNPIAGTGNKSYIKDIIIKRTTEQAIPFELLSTSPDGDYRFLEEKIKNDNVTDIIIVGGDGSISQVAGSLRHTGVHFGIIPCGSGNGLALTAGIPRIPDKALDIIFEGKSGFIDSFYINNRFSCMLSGIGFDAQVAHEFAKQPERGLWTYMRVTAKNFFNARPRSFQLTVNGNSISTKAFFISIANSNQFGNQFTIAPRASLTDGMLDIVVVQKMSKLQVLWSVLQQMRYGNVNEDMFSKNKILYFHTKQLEIGNPGLAPLHIDGDPAETAGHFTVSVVPSAFKLIQPSKMITSFSPSVS
jgi:diacylglycerol kinase (ATP)